MNKKTLYISDLDRTLLNSEGKLSKFTYKTINNLIQNGIMFTYATARSIVTADKICEKLNLNIPVIVHNGIFITDSNTKKIIEGNYLKKSDSKRILKTLIENDVYPFAHTIINGKERISYCTDNLTSGMKTFLEERKNDDRLNLVKRENLTDGDVFHFTCIAENEKLLKLNEIFKDDFHSIYYKDVYSENMWLEILPKGVTKGTAIEQLKNMLNAEKVVCFGDGVNDVEMFEKCDKCYAVENGDDIVRKMAHGIIDSNDNDGVAKFLMKNTLI
jgi:Cof subfamily protein (haloacid dehalogenase superfamily)